MMHSLYFWLNEIVILYLFFLFCYIFSVDAQKYQNYVGIICQGLLTGNCDTMSQPTLKTESIGIVKFISIIVRACHIKNNQYCVKISI